MNALTSSKTFWTITKTIRKNFTNLQFPSIKKNDGAIAVSISQISTQEPQGIQSPAIHLVEL